MSITEQETASRPSCFLRHIKQIVKKFPLSKNHIEKFLASLEQHPFKDGDRMPGFFPSHVRKARTGLPEYRIGKSGGLRIIYLAYEDDGSVLFLAAYHKGEDLSESDITALVKANLKELTEP
jgi:mRNA-degrading endonuclease RelE of RelBE toxin-antitoxin system